YYRLNPTRLLAGEVSEADLPVYPREWYEKNGVRLQLGAEVESLDLAGRQVMLRDGEREPFTKLILAAGSHPFMPPLPGLAREGVKSLRSFRDALAIREAARAGARCVCIGGGLLGLETAGALARRGARVAVLESFPWLLPRQLNKKAAALLARYVGDLGIEVYAGARVAEILGDERARAVLVEDKRELPADLVIIAIGVRPNTYLARQAGLQVNQGVVVDDHLTSSHPDVLAAGDVAEHRGVLYGIWPAAKYQGSIAGRNAAGARAEFAGIPRSNTLKVLGLDLFSIGQVEPSDGSYEAIEEERDGQFYRFLFRDSLLVGAVLLGDTGLTAKVKRAVENRVDFSALLARHPAGPDVLDHLAQKPG
ncbi:MAG: FAD-dependent oxidoreductase, partial [Dehalococcoidales bacterium]|nr:FAD-dependent oxidoreductase [Dehalococcoidales bacterium]